jgi:hypothetical protein
LAALFPTLVYSLCFATATLCAYLLGRSYRRVRSRMLFWSATCFALLAVANFVVILDMLIFPDINFRPWRLWITLIAVSVLLFGFIWDEEA